LAFAFDDCFRSASRFVNRMRWFAVFGFGIYALLQFFPPQADILLADILNSTNFQAVTGISTNSARATAVMMITIGMFALLNHFDAVMRRQTQEALARVDAQLRKALEITGLGSWEWDIVGDTANWSDEMRAIFGAAQDCDLDFEFFVKHVHTDDREAVKHAVRFCFENHTPYKMKHRLIAADGRVKIVEARGEVEFGHDGKPNLMSGSMLDITELEEARAAIHKREAKLSRLLEVAPEAIIITDEKGRIVLFNEGAQDIFGHTAEETMGHSIDMSMPERFRRAHHGHIHGFAAGSDSNKRMGERNEIAGVRKNGEEFPARATISKYESSDGVSFTVWLRDSTHSKMIRDELLAAKAAAEAASAAKSNFIAHMSHELRTPLNAILGFSELMETETFGPLGHDRYREYAGDIRRSGAHLLSVISDILNISQLDAGKTILNEMDAVDVTELLEECAKWVGTKADASRVELVVNVASDVPPLWGDRRLLTQIFLNLLSNAVKFTPEGGMVEVFAEENHDAGVRVGVKDTGIGMTVEQAARGGEQFLQFDETRSRKFEGTGLGLSIAKRLIELHGGRLEVESAPDVGTTFTVTMPPGPTAFASPEAPNAAWG
jgi:PAS domain S-box-containing protein